MKFSASSLSMFSKCGEQARLQYIENAPADDTVSMSLPLGKIMERTIQEGCLQLNAKKSITSGDLMAILAAKWVEVLAEYNIVPELGEEISRVILSGFDRESSIRIDDLSHLINCSGKVTYNVPKIKKDGTYSSTATRPALSMMVQRTGEDVMWWFSPDNEYLDVIRNADSIVPEHYFTLPLGGTEREVVINGVPVEDSDYVDGYIDLYVISGGKRYVFEFKYGKTSYTQGFVEVNIQVLTYKAAIGMDTTVVLFDIHQRKYLNVAGSEESVRLALARYEMMASAFRARIFIPVCGTDPYTTKSMLCKFKDSGQCCYAPAPETAETEEEYLV